MSGCTQLQILALQNNKLTGTIPSELGNSTTLELLYLGFNNLEGFITQELGNLYGLEVLNLQGNSLRGSIPNSLFNISRLRKLVLNQDYFLGSLPSSIGNNMPNLEVLYLDLNNLTGLSPTLSQILQRLPQCLGNAISLRKIHLSFNQLTSSMAASLWNLKISSGKVISLEMLDLSNNSLTDMVPKSLKVLHSLSYFNVSFNKLSGEIPSGGPFANFTYLYFMSNEGICGKPQFHVPPCKDSSLYRSRNRKVLLAILILITIVTIALIFAIMLVLRYPSRQGRPQADSLLNITLERIYTINLNEQLIGLVIESCLEKGVLARDVSCAVEYLHHGYFPLVVYCDLKPSNILLDQDMVGRVSDFGIEKLLGEEETIQRTTSLATLGYISPEYGAEGLVSTSCDVYSFGIILMETFTSRRPTNKIFFEDLSFRKWVESPQHRPSMKGVVITLKKIKVQFLAHSQQT
ncbi:LRR receptor-like serine threonine- kinase EFR [Olea europaea subsp. europaea]|uniref:LRR receptor-like serine threonine- kinase EFR n=1 Tax=Olea europaea subsp. europaea TaxID=158383 RepID=A0A8S0RRC1_OLEEU|nr:LRR receptor-like serine threonine- kinase EFR [Olea europaea subsp. europaea]